MKDGLEKIVRRSLNERLTFSLLFSGSGLNCAPEIFEAPYLKACKHNVLRVIRPTPFYLALHFVDLFPMNAYLFSETTPIFSLRKESDHP